MTKKDKRRFIRELIGSVKKTVLANVDKMPEEWDGIELRQYISDVFARNSSLCFKSGLTKEDRRRERDYANEVLVRNL